MPTIHKLPPISGSSIGSLLTSSGLSPIQILYVAPENGEDMNEFIPSLVDEREPAYGDNHEHPQITQIANTSDDVDKKELISISYILKNFTFSEADDEAGLVHCLLESSNGHKRFLLKMDIQRLNLALLSYIHLNTVPFGIAAVDKKKNAQGAASGEQIFDADYFIMLITFPEPHDPSLKIIQQKLQDMLGTEWTTPLPEFRVEKNIALINLIKQMVGFASGDSRTYNELMRVNNMLAHSDTLADLDNPKYDDARNQFLDPLRLDMHPSSLVQFLLPENTTHDDKVAEHIDTMYTFENIMDNVFKQEDSFSRLASELPNIKKPELLTTLDEKISWLYTPIEEETLPDPVKLNLHFIDTELLYQKFWEQESSFPETFEKYSLQQTREYVPLIATIRLLKLQEVMDANDPLAKSFVALAAEVLSMGSDTIWFQWLPKLLLSIPTAENLQLLTMALQINEHLEPAIVDDETIYTNTGIHNILFILLYAMLRETNLDLDITKNFVGGENGYSYIAQLLASAEELTNREIENTLEEVDDIDKLRQIVLIVLTDFFKDNGCPRDLPFEAVSCFTRWLKLCTDAISDAPDESFEWIDAYEDVIQLVFSGV